MSFGADFQEIQKQFEVKNFEATCSIMTASSEDQDPKGVCKMVLPTWHAAHGLSFQITLSWEAHKPEGSIMRADPTSWLGLSFTTKQNSTAKKVYGKLFIELINNEPAQNRKKAFESFVRLFPGRETGWFSSPSQGMGVKLGNIFDVAKGWLQTGILRLQAKLQLATEGNMLTESVEAMPQANLQTSLLTKWGQLFQSGEDSDVAIIVISGENIRAHSLVLKTQSKVFAAALSSSMQESTGRRIVIDGLAPLVVRAMLGFLYSGEVDPDVLKSNDHVLGLLEAAHRYDISSLESKCIDLLASRLDVNCVAEWLHISELIGNEDFKARCLNFINGHVSEVQGTEGYSKYVLPRPALLAQILSSMFPPAKRPRIVSVS